MDINININIINIIKINITYNNINTNKQDKQGCCDDYLEIGPMSEDYDGKCRMKRYVVVLGLIIGCFYDSISMSILVFCGAGITAGLKGNKRGDLIESAVGEINPRLADDLSFCLFLILPSDH